MVILLAGLTACSGMESSVRDLNRSLYRSWAGSDNRLGRNTQIVQAAQRALCLDLVAIDHSGQPRRQQAV